MTLRTDGFYRSSSPIEWSDWHAGIEWKGSNHQFWRFFPSGRWVMCCQENPKFGFWKVSEGITEKEIAEALRCFAGTTRGGLEFHTGLYTVEGGMVTVVEKLSIALYPKGEMVHSYSTSWRLAEDRLLPGESTFTTEISSDAGSDIPQDEISPCMCVEQEFIPRPTGGPFGKWLRWLRGR